jgi:cysteine desulfurase
MKRQPIYLDHGATTPVSAEVRAAMEPFWAETYGNPASQHTFGRLAMRAVVAARKRIADLLNAQPDEIIFTACGSESDNLALRGVMWAARAETARANGGQGNHLITSTIEHGAVSATARQLQTVFGFDVTFVPVDSYGVVDLQALEAAIRPDTALISIMAANNEIGTVQPIERIGELARQHHIPFHTDAVQAIPTRHWDMSSLPIDLLTIAPHKFYGPKGIGILYVRQGTPLIASQTGGGHENGLRAGTVNTPLAVGAAEALHQAMEALETRTAHYERLRDRLIEGVLAALPEGCILTGHPTQRLPHNASFAFRYLNGNDLLIHLDLAGIAASSGSACSSGDPKPSAVLEALGLDESWTRGGLRLTVGRQNTLEEIEYTIATIADTVQMLQAIEVSFAA